MVIVELLLYLAIFFVSYLLMKSSFSKDENKKKLPPSPLSLPIIGHLHLLSPFIHHSFHKLSKIYGDLFYLRIGSVGCAVATSPQVARELLKTNELNFATRKHTAAIDHLTYSSSFAFAPYGPYWKFIKKISTVELLGSRTLNQFLPIRTKELHHLVGFLLEKSRVGESVNVTEELLKLTNNVIAQMMFSKTCSGKEGWAARTVVREVTEIFGEFNVSDMIWIFKNWDVQGFRKRFVDIHRRYDSLLEGIIKERETERSEKKKGKKENNGKGDREKIKDFLEMMLDALEDDDNSELQLSRNHVKALILDFLTAATDTTATAVEWALAELINNPSVLRKAQKEIDEYMGKSDPRRLIQESDIPNLPYLQAIVKENFRLHPPIPMLSRKSIEDCQINDYTIPEGSLLFVNIWAIGRDPSVWKNPMKFEPERFLNEENIDVRGLSYQLLPFGSGRRGCPGISLAMLELPTVLGALIQCFDWEVNGGKNVVDMSERPGLTAPRAQDLVCVPVARFTPTGLPAA